MTVRCSTVVGGCSKVENGGVEELTVVVLKEKVNVMLLLLSCSVYGCWWWKGRCSLSLRWCLVGWYNVVPQRLL